MLSICSNQDSGYMQRQRVCVLESFHGVYMPVVYITGRNGPSVFHIIKYKKTGTVFSKYVTKDLREECCMSDSFKYVVILHELLDWRYVYNGKTADSSAYLIFQL